MGTWLVKQVWGPFQGQRRIPHGSGETSTVEGWQVEAEDLVSKQRKYHGHTFEAEWVCKPGNMYSRCKDRNLTMTLKKKLHARICQLYMEEATDQNTEL